MAVKSKYDPIESVEDWYSQYEIETHGEHQGMLRHFQLAPCSQMLVKKFEDFKREHLARVAGYDKLEMLADGEVITPRQDLPNVSSGEAASIVRSVARNLVQHTPNIEVISEHDDESVAGIFSRHILLTKIISDSHYSNDMQQKLFSSTKKSFTLGFDAVVPVLLQDSGGSWYIKYDTIRYSDVFPDPGAKNVKDSQEVFVRRYLSKADVVALIRNNTKGWDIPALKALLKTSPPMSQKSESVAHQHRKHRSQPDGYEIVTYYSSTGDPFLTFSPHSKLLLRVEKNKHPLQLHPVHFLVLENDSDQPLGVSQIELILGRQEFQDLMLNGSMKLWYQNINPSLIGYGTVNALPNLSPGKFTEISNPNARIEAFEVSTQTLLQAPSIMERNHGSMVNAVGAADRQMASQAGSGMSATPQGVEAQNEMIDVTTNNYQKAIESFFSRYCSYALTLYFNELKGVKKVKPSADARKQLLNAGLPIESFTPDGELDIDFDELATNYYVRCVPGTLVEMEDEKQLRILQGFLVPLSQAMPAFAASQDEELIRNSAKAIQYIMTKVIELSGSSDSSAVAELMKEGSTSEFERIQDKARALEENVSLFGANSLRIMEGQQEAIAQLSARIEGQEQVMAELLNKLGVQNDGSDDGGANETMAPGQNPAQPVN